MPFPAHTHTPTINQRQNPSQINPSCFTAAALFSPAPQRVSPGTIPPIPDPRRNRWEDLSLLPVWELLAPRRNSTLGDCRGTWGHKQPMEGFAGTCRRWPRNSCTCVVPSGPQGPGQFSSHCIKRCPSVCPDLGWADLAAVTQVGHQSTKPKFSYKNTTQSFVGHRTRQVARNSEPQPSARPLPTSSTSLGLVLPLELERDVQRWDLLRTPQ